MAMSMGKALFNPSPNGMVHGKGILSSRMTWQFPLERPFFNPILHGNVCGKGLFDPIVPILSLVQIESIY